MTHLCCQPCRLRFTTAAAAYLIACPECGLTATAAADPAILLGFKLFDPLDATDTLPDAIAVALRQPELN